MILDILRYPDERLHKQAAPVEKINDDIRRLVKDMTETMYHAPGIGLAATQVNVHKQIIVIDVSPTRDQLLVLINPEITHYSGKAELEEGCLSLPGITEVVERSEKITVKALGLDERVFTLEAEGLLSVCIQHEIDHLKGKVFVEYLSRLKQSRIRTKLLKQEREAA